ncbi:TonB-dependent receptor domain-containing protein [Stutzerimonas kirkiae]|uniref:TonB-dependent receptor domain-containing protein n=1 Tax=Stutzerimonas kirkiae TaxID=2211392 RepID=UPI0010385CE7|nr:TonB-dependent receptor [Stutzerimonas kirkiae]TBV10898.1 TonB-dependent receptor [Stutzerimonas kirkiae]TBV14258.1 TonB-dependent receptor [Stutzerimonas kirkiae]
MSYPHAPSFLLRSGILGCLLCGTSLAQAQESLELGSTVVTASAAEQTLREAPASITVIDAEEIARRPVLDLADLLGRVEGVTLSRSGNTVPGVQLRGFGQAYTLILIDGRRVNSTSNAFRGNDYDTGWIAPELIERIEVVRGPMSSLYGSDAIGGVINIITKKASPTWRGNFSATTITQQDRDAGDAWKTSASLSGPLVPERLLLKLSAAADRRQADHEVNGSGQDGLPANRNNSTNGELTWFVDEANELSLNVDSSRRNHYDFVLRREAYALTHKGEYGFGSSEFSLQADETRNLDGSISGENNPNEANTYIAQGRLALPLWQTNLRLGGEWKREELDDATNLAGLPGSSTYGQDPSTSVDTSALFVDYDLPLLPDLRLTLGNRYDRHENFGGHNSPRAYLVWQHGEHLTIKSGWAKAFRAPTLLQNSPNWGSASCGSQTDGCYIIGSQDLEPETSKSKEISLLLEYPGWGGSLTVYRNDLRNMIDIQSRTRDVSLAPSYGNFIGFLNDGRPVFAYQNLDKVRTQGAELSLHKDFGSDWRTRLNYSYLDARNLSDSSPTPMIYRPRHSANLSIDWDASDRLEVSTSARYTGTQLTSVTARSQVRKEAYTLFDLGLRYRLSDDVTLGTGLLNAFDRKVDRDVTADFNEERRRIYASLSVSF